MTTITPGFGICGCGCGRPTSIAEKSSTRSGWVRGQPKPFLKGHMAWKNRGPRWIDGPVPETRPDLGPCWVWQRSSNSKGYAVGGFAKYGFPPGAHLAGRALYTINV